MMYVVMLIAGVIGFLLFSLGGEFLAQFIPVRLLNTIFIIAGLVWLRWALKDVIKEAVSEAIEESKD